MPFIGPERLKEFMNTKNVQETQNYYNCEEYEPFHNCISIQTALYFFTFAQLDWTSLCYYSYQAMIPIGKVTGWNIGKGQ